MFAIVASFSIAAIWLLRADNDARERFFAVFGWSANPQFEFRRGGHNGIVAVLVFVALLVVINPEVRLLLLFIDGVGLDIFVLLVFFQLRGSLSWICRSCACALRHTLCDWGPLPFCRPTSGMLRVNPFVTVFSFLSPVVALGFLAAPLVLSYMGAMTVVHLHL